MERKDRYRNQIKKLTLVRFFMGGLLLLATGVGFVMVRNQHVVRGNEIRNLEESITRLDREIEMWELRVAGVRDRQELTRRLRWVKSDLAAIDESRVIEISASKKKILE